MARLASVSLQNSRPSLTPMVSISLIVSTPCRKRPPHAGCDSKQLPFDLKSNYNTHCAVFIHAFSKSFSSVAILQTLVCLHVTAVNELEICSNYIPMCVCKINGPRVCTV